MTKYQFFNKWPQFQTLSKITFPLKNSVIFVKFKKQNVVCAHEFSWSPRKLYSMYHMWRSNNFGSYFGYHFCWEYFFTNLKLHTFLYFVTNFSNRMNNFYEIKETKCRMYTWIFLVHQESCIYHIHCSLTFPLSCKMTKM